MPVFPSFSFQVGTKLRMREHVINDHFSPAERCHKIPDIITSGQPPNPPQLESFPPSYFYIYANIQILLLPRRQRGPHRKLILVIVGVCVCLRTWSTMEKSIIRLGGVLLARREKWWPFKTLTYHQTAHSTAVTPFHQSQTGSLSEKKMQAKVWNG